MDVLHLFPLALDELSDFGGILEIGPINLDDGDDTADLVQESIVGVLEVGEILESDGGLHRTVAALDALQALFGRDIQVDNQVGLAPISSVEDSVTLAIQNNEGEGREV